MGGRKWGWRDAGKGADGNGCWGCATGRGGVVECSERGRTWRKKKKYVSRHVGVRGE